MDWPERMEKIAGNIQQLVTAIDSALQTIPHPLEILSCTRGQSLEPPGNRQDVTISAQVQISAICSPAGIVKRLANSPHHTGSRGRVTWVPFPVAAKLLACHILWACC